MEDNSAKGSTLAEDVLAFWVECAKTFMGGSVPLSKIDHFAPLLSEYGLRLTRPQHLADIVPMIRDGEISLAKQAISGKKCKCISIIFHGTTALRKAMCGDCGSFVWMTK